MKSIEQIHDNIKFYVPCITTLLVRSLRLAKLPVYLSLFSNNGLPSIPNFKVIKCAGEEKYKSDVKFSQKLGYSSIIRSLGIEREFKYFSSFDEGLEYIKEENFKSREVVIGVSTYFLPYSKDYQSKNYINGYSQRTIGVTNHYVAILNSNSKYVEVFDSTPKVLLEKIDIEVLKLAWEGDNSIEELKKIKGMEILKPYTYFFIKPSRIFQEVEVRDLSLSLVKTIIQEFLSGSIISEKNSIIYYGVAANTEIILYLDSIINKENTSNLKELQECLFEMRISRYFFRDILSDLSVITTNLDRLSIDYNNLVKNLDYTITRLCAELLKKNLNYKKLGAQIIILEKIFQEEASIYLRLGNKFNKYKLLKKRYI